MDHLVLELNRLRGIFNEIVDEDAMEVVIYQLKSIELEISNLVRKNKL